MQYKNSPYVFIFWKMKITVGVETFQPSNKKLLNLREIFTSREISSAILKNVQPELSITFLNKISFIIFNKRISFETTLTYFIGKNDDQSLLYV